MNIEEIKNKINESKFEGNLEGFIDEYYNEFKDIKFDLVEKKYTDEHRWFCIDTNVYKFTGDKSLGYLAIEEVGVIKSEEMTRADCGVELKAYLVKKIMKESFEICK